MSNGDDQTRTVTQAVRPPVDDAGSVGLVICSADELRVATLTGGRRLVLGRASDSDVQLEAPSLSRTHACFGFDADGPWVEDLDSHNGVQLNGAAVRRAALREGDVLQLGEVTVLVTDADDSSVHGSVQSYEPMLRRIEEAVKRSVDERSATTVLCISGSAEGRGRNIGHWCGALRRQLRPVDGLGVYGPTTALALLPDTDLEAARLVANRLAVQDAALSIGLASFPEQASSAGQLVARAMAAARSLDEATGGVKIAQGRETERDDVIVVNNEMRQLYDMVTRIARTDVPVLIFGETGTGKELVAAAVHRDSRRHAVPMQVVNCAAIAETLLESMLFGHERGAFTGAHKTSRGVFEQADGGTLFLDEIGELAAGAQAALLRALETKRIRRLGAEKEIEVDVRIVAATHRPLEEMVERGEFREDLLHRLNTFTVHVPELRNRKEEILPLAEHFLARARKEWSLPARQFTPQVEAKLLAHDWPGNARELRNVVERAAAICGGSEIGVQELPEKIRGAVAAGSVPHPADVSVGDKSLKQHLRELEEALIRRALEECGGNQVKAAQLLQMPRRTLVQRLRDYNLNERD